jgi:hypothetical protein
MDEFLKTLKESDFKYWEEFLSKALAIQEEKFSIRKCGIQGMPIYRIEYVDNIRYLKENYSF